MKKSLLILSALFAATTAMAEKVELRTPNNSFVIDLNKGEEPQFIYYGPALKSQEIAQLQKMEGDNYSRSELYPSYGATHTV